MDKQTVCKIFNAMYSEREGWVPVWRDIASYICPTRGIFDDELRTEKKRTIDHKKLLDSDPLLAVEILAAGMVSGLTSPSRPWFVLSLPGKRDNYGKECALWLDEVKERMEHVFGRSNLYTALHAFYQEVAVFGIAAFLLEEDYRTGVRCIPFTIGEFAVDTDGKGKINRFARRFKMTAAQLMDQFGKENLPQRAKTALANHNDGQEFTVYHLIIPNDGRALGKKDKWNMPFASYYWTDGQQNDYLRTGGYHEFPVIVGRWEIKNDTDVYGKAPGWKCLGDAKMLQRMQKAKLVALDKSTNPPMMVSSKVQGEVNLLPGGLTRYNGTSDAAIKPAYQIQPDLKSLEASIQAVRSTIRSQFFADVFLMLTAQNYSKMTATEVAERHQEKMLIMGPVLERLKNELLDPLIERTFGILYRTRQLPEAPEELQGSEIQVEYVSIIAQAQKAQGVQPIQQGLSLASALADAQLKYAQAGVIDNVDFDAVMKEACDVLGVPAVMTRSEDDVQRLRQNRAQQMRAAAEAQQAQMLVEGAKTLSDTKLGQGSALDALAGGEVA